MARRRVYCNSSEIWKGEFTRSKAEWTPFLWLKCSSCFLPSDRRTNVANLTSVQTTPFLKMKSRMQTSVSVPVKRKHKWYVQTYYVVYSNFTCHTYIQFKGTFLRLTMIKITYFAIALLVGRLVNSWRALLITLIFAPSLSQSDIWPIFLNTWAHEWHHDSLRLNTLEW